jgi:hypothetical protein
MSKILLSPHPWGRAPRPIEFRPSILGRAFFQIMQLESWGKFWELKPPLASTVHHSQLKRRKIFFSKKFLCWKVGRAPTPEVELLNLLNFDPASLVEVFFRYCSWKAEKKIESWSHPLQVQCAVPSWKGEKIFFRNFFYVENLVEPPPLRSSSSTYWISTQHPRSCFFSNTAAGKLRKILRAETTPFECSVLLPAQKEKKYFFENFSMSKIWLSPHPWGRAPRPTEFRPSILGRDFFQILQLES